MENIIPYNTLFLDRDGVINVRRPGDYVKSVAEFVFIDGTLEALRLLSGYFHRIVVVTNQRGVGKGRMSRQELDLIHHYMLESITAHEGRIDRIYVSTAIDDTAIDRKPNPGMAFQAKQNFPDINFSESWMAGDSVSDMQFANNLGIRAILIGNKCKVKKNSFLKIYAYYPDLLTFAKELICNF
jgi:D-glycero-D-manno-heptose 1,7-bisphosphate phosphatase/D-glycero-alpha-D-manno-heptose 1-phosphate guanylyltransferase